MNKRKNGHQNPDLTKEEIDKRFSDVLKNLLIDGYRFVYDNEMGVVTDCYRRVVLEKEGSRFLLAEVEKEIECQRDFEGLRYTESYYKLTLMLSPLAPYIGRSYIVGDKIAEHSLVRYHTYYVVSKRNGKGTFYYSKEEPVRTICEKRLERRLIQKWRDEECLMTIHLKQTRFVGFRKNVTIKVFESYQQMINSNGKKAFIHRSCRGLWCSSGKLKVA